MPNAKVNPDLVSARELADRAGTVATKISYMHQYNMLDKVSGTKKFSLKECLPIVKAYLKKQNPKRKTKANTEETSNIVDELIAEAKARLTCYIK